MLQNLITVTLEKYTNDEQFIYSCWNELEQHYTEPHRAYHTLEHLSTMITLLNSYPGTVNSPDVLLMAIFYHDIIYDPERSDNEQRSADLMKERLSHTSFEQIEQCSDIIMATASHRCDSGDPDTTLLLDLDIAILGMEWKIYENYTKQIREEYRCFNDSEYCSGRVKVLRNFLKRERLYGTPYFFDQYEVQARENISREIEELEGYNE